MNAQPFYPTQQVLESTDFFWVGRGGYAITNPGNARVRAVIANKAAEYNNTPRTRRGQVARALLKNELAQVKFVIPRGTLLANLESDDKKEASREKFTRKVGEKRREGLLALHGGLDQIRSYPEDVCIEVGFVWTLDILNHQLREDADAFRTSPSSAPAAKPSGPKKKKKRNNQQIEPAVVFHAPQEDQGPHEGFERLLDAPLPDLVDGLNGDECIDSLFAALFPEEAGEQPPSKRQRMLSLDEDIDAFMNMGELEEADTLDYFDGMFSSSECVEALLAA